MSGNGDKRSEVVAVAVNSQDIARDMDGSIKLGTWVMLVRSPPILKLLRDAGLDYARFDMEHTPISFESIGELVGAAESAGIQLCVRPPAGRREWIGDLIAAGVRDLFVPQVHTPATAELIVKAVKEALPVGDNAHIAVMLESIEAFSNLDEIARVEGIDTLAMGPADLAQELGIYGSPEESTVVEKYRLRLRDAALKHQKNWEMGVWSDAEASRWIEAGCRLVTYQTETTVLRHTYGAVVSTFAGIRRANRGWVSK